jgi:hypothetical protein
LIEPAHGDNIFANLIKLGLISAKAKEGLSFS